MPSLLPWLGGESYDRGMRTDVLRVCALATLALAAASCGDSSDTQPDAAPTADAQPPGPADSAVGVVCPNAEALYQGNLGAPRATDDETTLTFFASLDGTGDSIRIVASSEEGPASGIALPSNAWRVSLCLEATDESCNMELFAYEGTLSVASVEGRFQASLTEVIFTDNLDAPTCSAALRQATVDVAILSPF